MTTATAASHPLEERVKDALRQELARRASAMGTPAATPDVTPAPVEEEKPIEVGKGQQLFSKLLKRRLPKGLHDFAVSLHDVKSLPTQVVAFVPAASPTYNIQVDEAHALMQAWEMGEKVLITGPTGSGKSSLVEYCCALTGRPFIRINMTGDIESSVLFGSLVVEGGATVWKDGPVTEAVRYGAVVCIDEWDVTPPEILFGLQYLLEEGGKLFLKEMPGDSTEKFIVPHKDFRLVCSGNTVGQGDDVGRFAGTTVQNVASIDRFQTTIVLDYLAASHETKIINDTCAGLASGMAEKMVSFAALVRTSNKQGNINLSVSPRTLINWGRKAIQFKNNERALRLAFANKLRESDRKIVGEFYQKVFGTAL